MRRFVSGLFLALALVSAPAFAVKVHFADPQLDFQLLRVLGTAPSGGADVAECLTAASKVKEGDSESWYAAWASQARRLEAHATAFLDSGQPRSAGEALWRAGNYWRTAEFYLHENPADPRILEGWRASRECFVRGARLQGAPITLVRIPYESTTLPAYFCTPDRSGRKRPLLIIQTGFDGTAEELYFTTAYAALAWGYNCLLFEGPGQGEMIRVQKIPFRPDWEKVVTPVVDWAVKRREVDRRRIALMGVSFGGYLAPRAAAFEPRLAALIANGGVLDMYANCTRRCPADIERILDDPAAAAEFDEGVREMMRRDVGTNWAMSHGMWVFGVSSPSAWLRALRPYRLQDVIGRIRCPTLVMDSENDEDMPGQARRFYDALTCPREYMLFRAEDGADEHCQVGAYILANERLLAWLDKVLKAPCNR